MRVVLGLAALTAVLAITNAELGKIFRYFQVSTHQSLLFGVLDALMINGIILVDAGLRYGYLAIFYQVSLNH